MLVALIEEHGKESVFLLGLGAAFILASFVAPWIMRSRLVWNEDLALQYQTAAANYHDALHHRARPAPATDQAFSAELNQAQSEYRRLQRRLDRAQSGGEGIVPFLRWSGGLLVAMGAGLSWRRRGFRFWIDRNGNSQ